MTHQIEMTAVDVALRRQQTAARDRIRQPLGRSYSHRRGINLIEVLIGTGTISLVLAVVVPAVQSAREVSRRVTCVTNLQRIGIALNSFADNQQNSSAGTAAPAAVGKSAKDIAPHVRLLPYLDQQALYEQFDQTETVQGLDSDPPVSKVNSKLLQVSVPVYTCPSDSLEGPKCNYRISTGSAPAFQDIAANSSQAAHRGYRYVFGQRSAKFPDGKSHTAAFAEKLSGDRDRAEYAPWRDLLSVNPVPAGLVTPEDALAACQHPVDLTRLLHFSYGGTTWVLSGYPQTWYNHVLTPNSSIPDCVEGSSPLGDGAFVPRSLHTGGVNVLFADGGVRFINVAIDLKVWRAHGSVAGGENIVMP